MKKMVIYYVLFIVVFGASVDALPSSWPVVDKIQQKMPQEIVVFFSFEDMLRTYEHMLRMRQKPGRVKYVVVGECNAWSFPGKVPRLSVGNDERGLERIEKKVRIAAFFNAENVAVFWGVGNMSRHESKEAVEAEIGELVQIVNDAYPTAEILVVSPYDVMAVTKLGPAYHKKANFHLSNPVGFDELTKRIPELEKFVY